MGSWYSYKCNKCNLSFSTDGPWEFYRDEKGIIKSYGHPTPCTYEAEKRGIYGLQANVFCHDCQINIPDFILVEYKKPVKENEKAWMWAGMNEPKKKYKGHDPTCPKCGKTHLILSPPDRKLACPRCKKGKIVSVCTMIS